MRAKLTKRIVEAVEAGDRDVILWDRDLVGFGLKVTPKGRRSYFLYYRTSAQQQRRPTIGRHGAVTVDEARQVAKRWLGEIALGKDISAERQAARRAESVSDLADRFIAEYAITHKKPRSVATDRANIENHIKPLLGAMKIQEVKRVDIDRAKVAIRDGKTARRLVAKARGRRIVRGGEGIANRVVALLSKMFACAEEWGLREDNPARGIRKYREKRSERFLGAGEIKRLLFALQSADQNATENPLITAAIRLLLFTGMRTGEVLGLRWRDVDLQKGCLILSDSKTGRRTIALSTHAAAAFSSIPRRQSDDLVFARSSEVGAVALQRPWYRIRESAGIDSSANLHSLRHTFASWSAMGGLSLAQVGAVLGHKSAQTTLRYSDHALEALRGYSEQTGLTFVAMTTAIGSGEPEDSKSTI